MAIYKLEDILSASPTYGAGLIAKANGKYLYFRQSDIESKKPSMYVDKTENKIMKKGDFFISRAGTIDTYYHDNSEEWVFAGYMVKYPIDINKAIPKYIYYWSKGIGAKQIYNFSKSGSTMPKMNPPVAKKLSINLPSLETQKQIIDIIEPFEKLENIIENILNSLLKIIRNLKSSESVVFSSVATFISNKKLNKKQISAKVMIKRNPLVANLEPKGTYKTNLFFTPKKTLLINTIRTYLEKFAISPTDCDSNGTLAQLKVKKEYETSVIHNLLNNDFWKFALLHSKGTKMPVISKKDILRFKIKKTKINIPDLFDLISKINILKWKIKETKIKNFKLLIK